jgi:D-3-phosphoglycerate dehydrogenase
MVRNMTHVDAALLEAAPDLQVIGRVGVGLDNLDLPAIAARGLVVCYPPEENAVSVAEFTFGLILALARRIPASERNVRAGRWDRYSFVGIELAGKTLGLLGLGRIGMRVAARARAFQMRVLAFDPHLVSQHPHVTETGATLVGFEELLAASDCISCHLPLTTATHHLLNERAFSLMKPGALVINTSRGGIIDERALLEALREGRAGGAALDVREVEPAPPGDLGDLPNVILTPHIAGWSAEALHRMIETVAADVDRVLSGLPPRNPVPFPPAGQA